MSTMPAPSYAPGPPAPKQSSGTARSARSKKVTYTATEVARLSSRAPAVLEGSRRESPARSDAAATRRSYCAALAALMHSRRAVLSLSLSLSLSLAGLAAREAHGLSTPPRPSGDATQLQLMLLHEYLDQQRLRGATPVDAEALARSRARWALILRTLQARARAGYVVRRDAVLADVRETLDIAVARDRDDRASPRWTPAARRAADRHLARVQRLARLLETAALPYVPPG